MEYHSSMDSYLLGCAARKSNMILLTFWHCWCEMQNGHSLNTFSVLFGQNREVLVGCLVGGSQVEERKRREERRRAQQSREIKALPEKTLGILVRKLFTVRMGMPFFSSCMRAITSSIWTTQGQRGRAVWRREREQESFFTNLH